MTPTHRPPPPILDRTVAWGAGLLSAHATIAGLWLDLAWLERSGIALTALAMLFLRPQSDDTRTKPKKRRGRTEEDEPLTRVQHHEIIAHFDDAQARAEERDPTASKLRAGFVSLNPAYNALLDRMDEKVALSLDPVLLLGPTGVGKTELARRIHELRVQAGLLTGKFVVVNCADFAADEPLDVLYGHVVGAFTGADRFRAGLIAEARGGTLFFDEVGDLSTRHQGALLRLASTKEYYRLGSDELLTTDAAFVFATLHDLGGLVQSGQFRPDMFSRIGALTFKLPRLADRPEDFPALFDLQVQIINRARGVNVEVVPEALERYLGFCVSSTATWPDNIRGFERSVNRMALNRRACIDMREVEFEIATLEEQWAPPVRKLEGAPVDAARVQAMIDASLSDESELPPELRGTVSTGPRGELIAVVRACRAARDFDDACDRVHDCEPHLTRKAKGERLRRFLARYGLTFEGLRNGKR